MKKRLISLLLTICMLAGVMSTGYAEEVQPVPTGKDIIEEVMADTDNENNIEPIDVSLAASDWVLASQRPDGTRVVDRKYSYIQRSYTTSSSSSLSGWTRYDSSWSWSGWGLWSNWDYPWVGASDSRQVETRKVNGQAWYNYYRYETPDGKSGSDAYIPSKNWVVYTTVKLTSPLTELGIWGNYSQGYRHWYNGKNYHTVWKSNPFITYDQITQYRYRDRYKIYTYYFYRDDTKESSSYPTGSNIRNIQEYVKYEYNNYTVTAVSESTSKGTVSGGGTYAYGARATLKATPKTGYDFYRWSDGDYSDTKTFNVYSNRSYTAYFTPKYYRITLYTNNSSMGTVSGSGTYAYDSNVTIKAVPKPGYRFVKWSDGKTQANRTIKISGDAEYTAYFEPSTYTITLDANGGSVSPASVAVTYKTRIPTLPTPKRDGYIFSGWYNAKSGGSRVTENTVYSWTYNITLYARWDKIVYVSEISLPTGYDVMAVGETMTISPTIIPADATDKTLTWTTTNPNVATVSNGKITAKSVGETKIVVTANNGVKSECTILVTTAFTKKGSCSTHVAWKLAQDGTLYITGRGEMPNYSSSSSAPWHSYRSSIKSIVVCDGITSVGNYAFAGCTELTKVSLPASLDYIGYEAFYNCSSLPDIVIPDGVESIDNRTFYGCTSLKNVIIGKNVKSIGYRAFCACSSLTNITLPAGLLSIDDEAFKNCSSLENISVPESVTYIGESAFYGCTALTSFTVPAGVTVISESAFSGCSALAEINLHTGVTSIENAAFRDCASLKKLSYAVGVKSIGEAVFLNCDSLADTAFLSSVQSIGTGAFFDCGALTDATIPDTVTNLGNFVFIGCNSLKTATIGNGLTYIPSQLFSGCKNLETVAIGSNVKTIYYSAFSNCDKLEEITLPAGLTTISEGAFCNCDGLKSIVIPDSVTNVGSEIFYSCDSLEKAIVGNGLTEISSDMFYKCINLTEVTIGNSVNTIDYGAFYGCSKLKNIVIPDSVKDIRSRAFYACSDLSDVTLGSGLENIYTNAFYDCDSIEKIDIPDSLKSIYTNAFCDCDKIEKIDIPDSVTLIGQSAFKSCDNLTEVTIGSGAVNISYDAFSLCKNLTGINVDENNEWYTSDEYGVLFTKDLKTLIQYPCAAERTEYVIPDAVTYINSNAFYNCVALASITMNKLVNAVDEDAFYGCTGITDVYYKGIKAEWATIEFGSGNGEFIDARIHYRAAYGTCGDNLTWILDEKGTLTVSGTGIMTSWDDSADVPWYGNRDKIKKVVVEDGVSGVGERAFRECKQIKSVYLSNTLISVDSMAFYECTNLMEIQIPASVESIGDSVFYGCENLGGIAVEDGNQYYKSDNVGVLYDIDMELLIQYPPAKTADNYTVPDSVKTIESYAFRNGKNLTYIGIPDSVTNIGDGAFSLCTGLTDVRLPNNLTTINKYLFYSCESLENIYIPAGITSIAESAFRDCLKVRNVYFSGTGEQWNSIDIGSHNEYVTKASVHYITAYGICGERLVWDVDQDGKLTVSGSGKMTQWAGKTDAPWYEYRESIKNIEFGTEVTNISSYAFGDLVGLTSVIIPPQISQIGICVFDGCAELESISVDSNDYYMSDKYGVLYTKDEKTLIQYPQGSKETSYSIPNTVTSISERAFSCNIALTSVDIGSKVSSIGKEAFYNCSSLTGVTIPASVSDIGEGAFLYCSGIDSFYVSLNNKNYASDNEGVIYNKDKTVLIQYPAGITKQKYTVMAGVCEIKNSAFNGCESLCAIVLPDTVTKIGIGAFGGCTQLTDIYYNGSLEQWTDIVAESGEGAFEGINIHCDLDSGSFGEGLTWAVDSYGILTISGNGAMTDWSTPSDVPWIGYKDHIKKAVIEKGITSIGSNAFNSFADMTAVSVADSVLSIGKNAFSGCGSLTSVALPERIKDISEGAFYGCTSLEEVTLPTELETIGWSAFYNCSSLKSVSLPFGLVSIGNYAFYSCSSLKSLTVPMSVTTLGSFTFGGCDSLEEITLPFVGSQRNINETEEAVFGYIFGYTDEAAESTVEQYYADGKKAYYYIPSSLKKVTLTDESLIPYGAFYGCSLINEINLPNKAETIGDNAFLGCSSLSKIGIDENNMKYVTDKVGVVYNKSKTELVQYPAGLAYTDYSVADTVWKIGVAAFAGASELCSVSIPKAVSNIEENAFLGCSNLEKVLYNGTSQSWNDITIGNGNDSLKNADIHFMTAYGSCGENLTWSVDEGDTLYISGSGKMTDWLYESDVVWDAFRYDIKNIVIGDGVTSIGDSAFSGFESLVNITFGKSVKSIGANAFYGCYGLTSVTIPDNVESIGAYAFYDCNALKTISVGNGVSSIGSNAFACCMSLEKIVVGADNQNYSSDEYGVFFDKNKTKLILCPSANKVESYTVADTVKSIDMYAFYLCDSLKEVNVGDSVETIGSYAFCECENLNSVKIGSGVKFIGSNAFDSCTGLCSIVVDGNCKEYSSDGYGVLFDKTKTRLVQYPVGNQRTEYEIPFTVNVIDEYAFCMCESLNVITIPEAVDEIGMYAFKYCYNIGDIYYEGTEESWNSIAKSSGNEIFSNPNVKIHYGSGANDIYRLSAVASVGSKEIAVDIITNKDVSGKLIQAALYDVDSKLIGYAAASPAETTKNVSLKLPANYFAGHIKIFLWESMSSLVPLSESLYIPIEKIDYNLAGIAQLSDGKTEVEISLNKPAPEEMLYIALYTPSGVLTEVKSVKLADEQTIVIEEFAYADTSMYVKAFLWSGNSLLMPLAEELTLRVVK